MNWTFLAGAMCLAGGLAPDLQAATKARDAVARNSAEVITNDDYPPVALRAELQGTTAVAMSIGPDGAVTKCVVTQSSGHDSLDRATCNLILSRARFDPALDEEGKPIASVGPQRIVWRLPVAQRRIVAESVFEFRFDFTADGKTEHCRTAMTNGTADRREMDCSGAPYPPGEIMGALRKTVGKSPTTVQIVYVTTFGDEPEPAAIRDQVGWERIAMERAVFTVNEDGISNDCRIDESRGLDDLITSLCGTARSGIVPFKDADGKPISRRVRTGVAVFMKPKGQ